MGEAEHRPARAGSSGTPPALPLLPTDPAQVGGYRLLGRLAPGGMGMVYLAEDDDGRLIAVKTVLPHYADDPELRARFVREAEVAGRLSGRWTPRLLAADTRGQQQWLALAYIAGPTLAERVQPGTGPGQPLPPAEVAELATGLAQAIDELHRLGLVHRDLKPANVICSPQGPKVIDFGIATGEDFTSITRTGLVIGTYTWTSPEQFNGGPTGPASDVFSWGLVVGYAALGRHPFVRLGEQPGQEVIHARMLQGRPDEAALRQALPDPLGSFLVAALRLDPAQRPTAGRLLARAAGPPRPPAPSGGSPEELFRTGWEQHQQGLDQAALASWAAAAHGGHPQAAYNVAWLLEHRLGRPEETEQWYRYGAGVGVAAAATAMGRIEADRGRPELAREWFAQAAQAGDVEAAAALESLPGAWPRAEPAPGTEALFETGWACHQQQDFGGAMRAWREAADAGHPAAAFNVGWLLDKHHGRPAEAEIWYRRSAARGSPEAMAKLGRLAQAQGDAAAAEAWFRQAAALGHEPAVQGLAGLLGQRGRPRRFWRRRAG